MLALISDEGENFKEDLEPVIAVLRDFLDHESTQTRMAALRWILHLYSTLQAQMQNHMDAVFPILLNKLSDEADEVVLLDLEVLSEMSKKETTKSEKDYFQQFINSLLELFRNDQK